MNCVEKHPFKARIEANKSCTHSLDLRLVRPAVSEGMCPTCKVPLEPCEHRACGCCGWLWTDTVLASSDDVLASTR